MISNRLLYRRSMNISTKKNSRDYSAGGSPCQSGRGMKISGTFSIGQRPGVTRTKIAKKTWGCSTSGKLCLLSCFSGSAPSCPAGYFVINWRKICKEVIGCRCRKSCCGSRRRNGKTSSSDLLDLTGMTRVVVTHTLEAALLRRYDGILVLKNGRIAESGSFDELMEKKGYFYALFTVAQG